MSGPALRLSAIRAGLEERHPDALRGKPDLDAVLTALEDFEAHVARIYAPRADLDALRDRVAGLEGRVEALTAMQARGGAGDGG